MSKYLEKTKSLLLVFLGKIRLVGYTLISSVLFHLSSSLVSDTPHWIIVLIYLLTFWNSIMKLINLRMLSKNAYPQKFIDKCIKRIRNNVFINRPQVLSGFDKSRTCLGDVPEIMDCRTWFFITGTLTNTPYQFA